MSDPNDFTTSLVAVIAALEDRVRHGVEQPASFAVIFKSTVASYELPQRAVAVTRVTGMRGRAFTVFQEGSDYHFGANRLSWIGERPDEGSRLDIEFTFREAPSGLTDFNPGSVAGTLLRAVAREVTLLYAEMDQAYRRAFIDGAHGVALDNVVALLGVRRIPAQKSKGRITFLRKKAATQTVVIPPNTRVADQSGRVFATTEEGRIPIEAKSVTVAIEALEPGPEGDVNADTLTLMPTPPPGVDTVTNEDPSDGGQDAEPDERLRERAKHALERAGNATTDAIRFAVLEVEGVAGVEVLDHQRDDSIPLGEVRVRYSGGDINEVKNAVERTRAAGILARVEPIVQITISGTFYLIPAERPVPGAVEAFLKAVADAIEALAIGAPLAVRRLSSLVFTVPGLADVAEAQLYSHRRTPSSEGVPITSDPLSVSAGELIRPNRGALKGVVLVKLSATANRSMTPGAEYAIDLQILDGQGAAPSFRNVSIDIHVTARATLRENPTQPPVRVGSFTKPVRFTRSATGTLDIVVADNLPDFRADDHTHMVEFTLTAAAYPGLEGTSRSFDVTV